MIFGMHHPRCCRRSWPLLVFRPLMRCWLGSSFTIQAFLALSPCGGLSPAFFLSFFSNFIFYYVFSFIFLLLWGGWQPSPVCLFGCCRFCLCFFAPALWCCCFFGAYFLRCGCAISGGCCLSRLPVFQCLGSCFLWLGPCCLRCPCCCFGSYFGGFAFPAVGLFSGWGLSRCCRPFPLLGFMWFRLLV